MMVQRLKLLILGVFFTFQTLCKTSVLPTVCYNEVGCFEKFLWSSTLPLRFPESPEAIDVTFALYTVNNIVVPEMLGYNITKKQLLATNFDSSKPIKFVIHGCGETFNEEWMKEVKNVIFESEPNEYNVFLVDYSKGASFVKWTDLFSYSQSAANTRVVGAVIAHFIQQLIEYTGIDVEDIHLIGHSLGAQVAGFAGKRFRNPNIGRITALDAAGPGFYENNIRHRLDESDAAYVDVIHTDIGTTPANGLGLVPPIGDDDFYPNGGLEQPGCGVLNSLSTAIDKGWKGMKNIAGCSHKRSWHLLLATPKQLDGTCQFVGYECDSYLSFENGRCGDCGIDGSKCSLFSLFGKYDNTTRTSLRKSEMTYYKAEKGGHQAKERRLFFKTSEKSPFCLHHYQIVLKISEDMPRISTGEILVSLHGTKRSEELKLVEDFGGFIPGKEYTHLFTHKESLGKIEKVELKWSFGGIQYPFSWVFDSSNPSVYIDKLEVNYLSNINPKIREDLSAVFRVKNNEIKSGNLYEFTRN